MATKRDTNHAAIPLRSATTASKLPSNYTTHTRTTTRCRTQRRNRFDNETTAAVTAAHTRCLSLPPAATLHGIKGPDNNPTSQLLSIMSNKCCSGTGKEGKTKEVAEDREAKNIVCEESCVIKLCVKDVCHTIMCVKDLGYRTWSKQWSKPPPAEHQPESWKVCSTALG